MTSWNRRRTVATLFALLVLGQALTVPPTPAQTTVSVFYPQGTAFPLQLYALVPDSHIPLVTPNGWNIGHGYGWADDSAGVDTLNALLQTFALNGIEGLPALPAEGDVPTGRTSWAEEDIASWIQALAPNTNIVYWDLPEELRYWKPDEWAIVQNYTFWTRTYDWQLRPNYMYIPTRYTKDQVKNYVPYRDIIPASAYASHVGWPHAWVRWRMEETISVVPTPAQTHHDFWQLIASGAQGIFVFSYFHRNDAGGALIPNWNLLQRAAAQITGPEQLGHTGQRRDLQRFRRVDANGLIYPNRLHDASSVSLDSSFHPAVERDDVRYRGELDG